MNKQRGFSGVEVVVVVVIVGVLALLGGIAWREFLTTKPVSTEKTTTTTLNGTLTNSVLPKIATEQSYGTGLSVRYPNTWTSSHVLEPASGQRSQDTTNITSPDGKITIQLAVMDNAAAAGPASDGGAQSSITLASLDVADTTVSGLKYLAYTTTPLSGEYSIAYGVRIIATATAGLPKNLAVGDSAASVFSVPSNFSIPGHPSLSASLRVNLNDLNGVLGNNFGSASNTTTSQQLQAAIKTDDFKVAKSILTSVFEK